MTTNAPGTPFLPRSGASSEQVAIAVNQALNGKINSYARVTLTANAASTTVNDPRIGADTVIFLMPQTANAAAELKNGTIYIKPSDYVLKTSYKITHANDANADKTYGVLLIG